MLISIISSASWTLHPQACKELTQNQADPK